MDFNYSNKSDYEDVAGGTLGEGTYGLVTKCKHRPSGKFVAMKKLKTIFAAEDGISPTTLREISMLNQLKGHPNVILLLATIMDFETRSITLVFPLAKYDLYNYIKETKGNCGSDTESGIDIHHQRHILKGICSGIHYMHCHSMFHRDLKPQNILVSEDGEDVWIADFGLGREHLSPVQTLTDEVVTLWYRSPELLLKGSQYGGGVDVWSIGCIMAELITGNALFSSDCEIWVILKIFMITGTPKSENWATCNAMDWLTSVCPQFPKGCLRDKVPGLDNSGYECLQGMLELDPTDRINSRQARMHPWINADEGYESILRQSRSS